MAIISVSLNDTFLRELDRLRQEMGFAGRSELIRAGIRSFAQEEKQRTAARGRQSAILMVVHADEYDAQVAGIKQDYEDLVRTHLHNKIDGDRCVELFVLVGDGSRICDVTNGFRTNKRMDTVKLVML